MLKFPSTTRKFLLSSLLRMKKYKRVYKFPRSSLLLFGPRGIGKSTFIKDIVKPDLTIDLLQAKMADELEEGQARKEQMRIDLEALNEKRKKSKLGHEVESKEEDQCYGEDSKISEVDNLSNESKMECHNDAVQVEPEVNNTNTSEPRIDDNAISRRRDSIRSNSTKKVKFADNTIVDTPRASLQTAIAKAIVDDSKRPCDDDSDDDFVETKKKRINKDSNCIGKENDRNGISSDSSCASSSKLNVNYWSCTQCTFENTSESDNCEVCS